jgi:hypothetical protein
MKKVYCFIFIIAVIAVSCQKHLSRQDAKSMITNSKNFPEKQNYEIVKSYTKDMHTEGSGVTIVLGEDEFEPKEKAIMQFVQKGLLQLNETPHREEVAVLFGTTIRTWINVEISMTEIGRKYLVQENANSYLVNLWETDINEITGIQEMADNKTAIVDYTISNKNATPFGEIFSDRNNVTQKSIDFSLYDDGWRLQR